MHKYVIIVASGKGERMGTDIPKQFIPVGGLPILMHTIKIFSEADEGASIIVVLPKSSINYWDELCKQYHFRKPYQITFGAGTRFHSVKNGLDLIPDGLEGVVAVHDGVRPFVPREVITRCFEAAAIEGAVVPVVPVVETMRQLSSDESSTIVNRKNYRLVQTPQAFRISILKQAYCLPYSPVFTDDASVVEALGYNVRLVSGDRNNIKITTPSDLAFAEFYVGNRPNC